MNAETLIYCNPLNRSVEMKATVFQVWVAALSVILLFTSCDPLSSVEYNIHNMTEDTVTVAMYKEILTSAYQGFDIVENDSVTTHYGKEDSISVAVLAPHQYMSVQREWSGIYREELVVPIWKFMKSITVEDVELSPERWNKESAWHLKTTGGGLGEGESRYYDLYLR